STNMIIGVPKETDATETRSAIIPATVARFVSLNLTVQFEPGVGSGSGLPDEAFVSAGAKLITDRALLLNQSDILLRVRRPPLAEIDLMKPGCIHISFLDPFKETELLTKLATR